MAAAFGFEDDDDGSGTLAGDTFKEEEEKLAALLYYPPYLQICWDKIHCSRFGHAYIVERNTC
jgi:hypothetical protein